MKMRMKMEKTTPKIFSDKEIFIEKFPDGAKVLDVFHPDNWGLFVKSKDKCLNAPKVSLMEIAEHYGEETTQKLVAQQFAGLHRLTGRDLPMMSVQMVADLFISIYGNQVTPYSLMIYFALYPAQFKDSFREYDAQDVLKQCSKFIAWWQSHQQQQDEQEEKENNRMSIDEVLMSWMSEGKTDEEIRKGGLYHFGMITERMIKEARKQLTAQEPF